MSGAARRLALHSFGAGLHLMGLLDGLVYARPVLAVVALLAFLFSLRILTRAWHDLVAPRSQP